MTENKFCIDCKFNGFAIATRLDSSLFRGKDYCHHPDLMLRHGDKNTGALVFGTGVPAWAMRNEELKDGWFRKAPLFCGPRALLFEQAPAKEEEETRPQL